MPRYIGARKTPTQKQPPLTHFLCLPLVTSESKPQLEASIQQFRDAVSIRDPGATSSTRDSGDEARDQHTKEKTSTVHPKAIRPVGALHCTLGVMSLSPEKLRETVEVLKGLDFRSLLDEAGRRGAETIVAPKVDDSHTAMEMPPTKGASSTLDRSISPPQIQRSVGPLKIDLRGLTSMHPPKQTSILYVAPSDPSQRLYPFCLAVQKVFKEKGFLTKDDRELKLHATIVNTIYAKGKGKRRPARQERSIGESANVIRDGVMDARNYQQDDRSEGHGPNANAPLKMDATNILERYRDFVWAENVTLDRIAICEMGARKVMNSDGEVVSEEYTEVASLALRFE